MYVLDVNVVLATHRPEHPAFEVVRPWVDAALAGHELVGVPSTVWASFIRLATHRRVFDVPTPLSEAFAFVEAMVGQPLYLPAEPGPRHLALVRKLCEEGGATGDLVPDAVLGAIALEHAATVVTLDRDFARFPSVTHLRPGP